ncbi:MAG: AraC family ligand binding domain-containing protein, partial [Planctomycetota bacterium]|nr:AraC family ligand binding domain-containing protein [Planctomycetota bacterium]
MPKSESKPQAVEDRLRAAGIVFQRLEDVPAKVIREVNRRAFPDMRSIELPEKTIRDSLKKPLLRDLLVTRIGYSSRLAGHYIPRPEGSLDHILLYCANGTGWLRMAGRQLSGIGTDTMLCIPAGVPHWYGADVSCPWSQYWIHFTGRQASEYFEFLGIEPNQPLMH